jgi:RHS repeat-associated protein
LGLLAVAGAFAVAACSADRTTGAPADDAVTIRSAVNTTVLVTVKDTNNAPQVGVIVYAAKQPSGGFTQSRTTNASGVASFSLSNGSYRFARPGSPGNITYDCDGNRVAKTVGGVTTRYLVDDLNPTGYIQVLEEVVGGAVQTRYTYGTSVVSQTRNVSATPATSYYGFDAHGNVTFLTDAGGAITDSYDQDAWGTLVARTGSTPNTRLYAGEEFDLELGLITLRARHYNPGTGRFITLDPETGNLRRPVTLNRYLYVGADAINLIDPSGRVETAEYADYEVSQGQLIIRPQTVKIVVKSQHAWANAARHNLSLPGLSAKEYETAIESAARDLIGGGAIEPGTKFRAVISVATNNVYDLWFKGFFVASTLLEVGTYWVAK